MNLCSPSVNLALPAGRRGRRSASKRGDRHGEARPHPQSDRGAADTLTPRLRSRSACRRQSTTSIKDCAPHGVAAGFETQELPYLGLRAAQGAPPSDSARRWARCTLIVGFSPPSFTRRRSTRACSIRLASAAVQLLARLRPFAGRPRGRPRGVFRGPWRARRNCDHALPINPARSPMSLDPRTPSRFAQLPSGSSSRRARATCAVSRLSRDRPGPVKPVYCTTMPRLCATLQLGARALTRRPPGSR